LGVAGAAAATETLILAFLVGALLGLVQLAWRGQLFARFGRVLRFLAGQVVPGVKKVPLLKEGESFTMQYFGTAICLATLATLWDLRSGGIAALLGAG